MLSALRQVKPKNRYIKRPLSFGMIKPDLIIMPEPICQTGNSDKYLLSYRDILLKGFDHLRLMIAASIPPVF